MKILATMKKCLTLVIIQLNENTDNLNKLVVGTMKDETAGVVIKEFAGLNS